MPRPVDDIPLCILIAATNHAKLEELRLALVSAGMRASDVVSANEIGVPLPHVVEDRDDFAGNAFLKATAFADWARVHAPGIDAILAEDSGLCVDALDGRPGVRSARFAGEHASVDENNAALCAALRACGLETSPAHYVCALALAMPNERRLVVERKWHGEIRCESRGTGGFGYDPHFWIDGGQRTAAELTPDEKAIRSHRGLAVSGLVHTLAIVREVAAFLSLADAILVGP